MDLADEIGGNRRCAVDAGTAVRISADMAPRRYFLWLWHQRLIDHPLVPEPCVVRAEVADEIERLGLAHQCVGQQAVAVGDRGAVLGVRHFQEL